MTKAFLETMVLKPQNEKFIIHAFSVNNLKKIKLFNEKKQPILKKRVNRKLSVNDLFA
jgi:hypothetical protein